MARELSNAPTVIRSVVDATVSKVRLQSLDLSFNELLDMTRSDELNITPTFQRLFRWSTSQRSRFIESLILEMPVPPIYVIETEEGRYELIDGLQRISSYLHLRGELQTSHLNDNVSKGEKLVLENCDIVTGLNGFTFDDLPAALQIRLKRAFIRVEVIRSGTDPLFKYHMFKRLNEGGELLSPQELRNCIIRLLGDEVPEFIDRCSSIDSFVTTTEYISEEKKNSSYRDELVLRFFAFRNYRDEFKHDISSYLTEYMEGIAKHAKGVLGEESIEFDFATQYRAFEKTFNLLSAALGEKAFGPANRSGSSINAAFAIYHYEAITIGLQSFIDRLQEDDQEDIRKLRDVLSGIKMSDEFRSLTTGGGKNSPGPLDSRISFVVEGLARAFT